MSGWGSLTPAQLRDVAAYVVADLRLWWVGQKSTRENLAEMRREANLTVAWMCRYEAGGSRLEALVAPCGCAGHGACPDVVVSVIEAPLPGASPYRRAMTPEQKEAQDRRRLSYEEGDFDPSCVIRKEDREDLEHDRPAAAPTASGDGEA